MAEPSAARNPLLLLEALYLVLSFLLLAIKEPWYLLYVLINYVLAIICRFSGIVRPGRLL